MVARFVYVAIVIGVGLCAVVVYVVGGCGRLVYIVVTTPSGWAIRLDNWLTLRRERRLAAAAAKLDEQDEDLW